MILKKLFFFFYIEKHFTCGANPHRLEMICHAYNPIIWELNIFKSISAQNAISININAWDSLKQTFNRKSNSTCGLYRWKWYINFFLSIRRSYAGDVKLKLKTCRDIYFNENVLLNIIAGIVRWYKTFKSWK